MSENNNQWNSNNGGTEFDDLFEKGLRKVSSFFSDNKNNQNNTSNIQKTPKGLLALIIFALIIFVVMKLAYQIQPGELGVVLQLGKYNRTAQPGLNFIIPFIEEIYKVDVEKINKEEFGFGVPAKQVVSYTALDYRSANDRKLEALMLTGDKNVIYLNWVVQYRISDPVKFLFQVKDRRETVRDISESVIRRLVGNRAFDYILDKREEIAFTSKLEMQDIFNKYNFGIQLETVQLLDVNPPDAVRDAFNEVNEADQERRRLKNEAQKIYNEKITKSKGEARQIVLKAEGYKAKRVNQARGETSRFMSIYKEYKLAKQVTKTRMYVEAMNVIIPKLEKVYIVDHQQKGLMPLLNMNQNTLPVVNQQAASSNNVTN